MPHTIAEPGFNWLFQRAPDAMLVADQEGRILAANARAEAMFQRTHAELLSTTIEDLVPARHRATHPEKRAGWHRQPHGRDMGTGLRCLAGRPDGTEFPAEVSLSPLENGADTLVMVAVRDVTERLQAEARLFEARERALVTLASISDAVITASQAGIVDYLNPAAEHLTGWSIGEASGQPLSEVFPLIPDSAVGASSEPVSVCGTGVVHGPAGPVSLRQHGGGLVPVAYRVTPLTDAAGKPTGMVVVFRDEMEERRIARRLTHEATHDSLTGLTNRAEFERRLAMAVNAGTGSPPATVIYFDLDRFKQVNDGSGHLAGDEVLRQVAVIMSGMVRQRDTIARLGGDEFVALLENCPLAQGVSVAAKVQRAIASHRFSWSGHSFRLGISAGAMLVSDASSAESLLLEVDAACYRSKAGGGVDVAVVESR